MLLPQVERLNGRKLGEDDDGLGLPGAHGVSTGAGVVVAVVDTGIDPTDQR